MNFKQEYDEAEYQCILFEPNDETQFIINDNEKLLTRFYCAENDLDNTNIDSIGEKLFRYYLSEIEVKDDDYLTWNEIKLVYNGFHKAIIGYINHQKMVEQIEQKQDKESQKNKIITKALIEYAKEISKNAKKRQADMINQAIVDMDTIPESATKLLLSTIELVIGMNYNQTKN